MRFTQSQLDRIFEPLRRVDWLHSTPRIGDTPQGVAIFVPVQCTYCSQWVNPEESNTLGDHVRLCWKCQEKYVPQISAFNVPTACQECNTPVETLAAMEPGDEFGMFVHWKDGVFQMLCRRCDAKYVAQRHDLYANTPFGYHQRKLK